MILVDTSVLVDVLRASENSAVLKFRSVVKEGIPYGITPIIYQEILQGAATEKEYRRYKHYFEFQRFFHPKDPIESYVGAARIFFDCRRKGITVRSTIDCLIAQTALEYDLYLLHNDKDFTEMAKAIPLKLL